ncbi:adenine phosphoribosyltransferase [Hoeflea marina]|uniref:Adenine phosphoribosyltransferase n=1 Tax=Hoeflea marina TaxID=274592 RepID=A0A317PMK6_9HYPH|nr:phosphoribosyltransferase family protein [Hoeflea marina]PWW01499.1 adenine phosphoribosyltransferase [Hoeflea marina]
MTDPSESPVTDQIWTVDVAGLKVDLPIVAIKPDFGISLMMVIDLGIRFGAHVGSELGRKLAPSKPDIVVGAATLGIPVAIEVTRALGLDDYVIVQKSPKIHLGNALSQSISSITSKGEQRLLLDRRSIPLLAGRRVVVVDDVVASGSSLRGSIDLVRRAGGIVVGVGVILTEARDWMQALGDDTRLLQSLAHIPQFTKTGDQGDQWVPLPETFL